MKSKYPTLYSPKNSTDLRIQIQFLSGKWMKYWYEYWELRQGTQAQQRKVKMSQWPL
jgi:hypothetical protein